MIQTYSRVAPGDSIRSDLMNQILAQLESLQTRVAALEGAGTVPSGVVAITGLVPASGQLHIGDEVQILGQNFGFSTGAQQVTFAISGPGGGDSGRIFSFKPGSNDQKLIFDFPLLFNPVTTARAGTMTVSNQKTSDDRPITVLPAVVVTQGGLDVSWESVSPATIVAGALALFKYKLTSRASAAVTVNFLTTFSGVANPQVWLNTASILDAAQVPIPSKAMVINPGQTVEFFVSLASVPGAANSTFSLNVTVQTQDGTIAGSSTPNTFTVGQVTVLPDPAITLTPLQSAPTTALDIANAMIQLTASANATVEIQARLTVVAKYDVMVPVVTGNGWSIARNSTTPATYDVVAGDLTTGTATRLPQYSIATTATADPTGKVVFTLKRQGQTTTTSTTLSLKLL